MAAQRATASTEPGSLFGSSGFLAPWWGLARTLLLLGLVVGVSFGCATAPPAAPQAPQPAAAPSSAAPQAAQRATVLHGTGAPHANIVLAADRGFYKAEGADVELRQFGKGAEAAEAFKAGVGDMLVCGEVPAMKLWTSFPDSVGFAATQRDTELTMIEAGPTVKTASDLKGKAIGVAVGSTMDYLLQVYLKQNNIKPEEVAVLNMSGGGDMIAALAKGDIVAFSDVQPAGWQAEETTKGAHLLTTAKGLGWNASVLTARRSWLEKNRDTAKKFVAGLQKFNKFALSPENFDQVSDLLAKYTKVAPELAKRYLPYEVYDVAVDPELKNHLTGVANFLIERKVLTRPLDLSKDFDTSVLKSIDPALVKWE